jgi:D-glycero-D-manno-heptose 1,7-bisphosphate phosphatase
VPIIEVSAVPNGVRPGAFLDLNGTLVTPVQVTRLDHLELLPNALEALRLITQLGYICVVVTVQSRIAKGFFSADEFAQWFAMLQRRVATHGIDLHGPYVCPHRLSDVCSCKKPNVELYLQAAADLGFDIHASVAIGDTLSDVEAARRLGCDCVLVRTGWGQRALRDAEANRIAHIVVDDVLEAAKWLLSRKVTAAPRG